MAQGAEVGPYAVALFYTYQEPPWSEEKHREVFRRMLALGKEHKMTGRGRIAREGVNCTLTGLSEKVRAYCDALRREYPLVFQNTDFKITDGLKKKHVFKALSLRKTTELVGYGLALKPPSLAESGAKHVDALEYHEHLKRSDACVIDVRNAYETEIGRIVPPSGGAELIDPQLRNSHEFPKWLALPETQAKLATKKTVLMYCTGGIRCERASALLDTMIKCPAQEAAKELNHDILMVKGGIERYLRAFPDGGFWQGKNYLFDKRMEQTAVTQRRRPPLGECAGCGTACDEYRGKFLCEAPACASSKVPVLVCERCRKNQRSFRCRLCRQGYAGASDQPLPACVQITDDLLTTKKRAPPPVLQEEQTKRKRRSNSVSSGGRHLFVGNLPYAVDKATLGTALGLPKAPIFWLVDRRDRLFYGAAVIVVETNAKAAEVINSADIRIAGRLLRLGIYKPDAPPTSFYADGIRPPLHGASFCICVVVSLGKEDVMSYLSQFV